MRGAGIGLPTTLGTVAMVMIGVAAGAGALAALAAFVRQTRVKRYAPAPVFPPFELLAPAQALLARVGGQEAMERDEARQAFASLRYGDGRPVDGVGGASAWFRIAPAVQPGIDPPLGWTLAPETVTDMRGQMLSRRNKVTKQLRGC